MLNVDARKRFGDFSLDAHWITDQPIVALVGPSGSGKSSLMMVVAGLERPTGGTVSLAGQDLGRLDEDALARLRRRHLGIVFQAFHLLPHLTIARNVRLPLDLAGVGAREADQRTRAMLAAVRLSEMASEYPRAISGGEAQRAAVARALVHDPALVLADEPTGNLDADNAAEILGLLRDQVKARHASGVLVTHSAAAARFADRIYQLTGTGVVPLRS